MTTELAVKAVRTAATGVVGVATYNVLKRGGDPPPGLRDGRHGYGVGVAWVARRGASC